MVKLWNPTLMENTKHNPKINGMDHKYTSSFHNIIIENT
jgi:hypothetical protein